MNEEEEGLRKMCVLEGGGREREEKREREGLRKVCVCVRVGEKEKKRESD